MNSKAFVQQEDITGFTISDRYFRRKRCKFEDEAVEDCADGRMAAACNYGKGACLRVLCAARMMPTSASSR